MNYIRKATLALCLALLVALTFFINLDTGMAATIPVTDNSSTPTHTPRPISKASGIWIPAQKTSWQWQLSDPVNTSINVQMYDIDMFDTSASVVAALHAKGRKVVCYISAGTYENWRPDAKKFPASVIGKPDAGWSGEYWLDIRRIDLLGPIMQARMNLCKQKGFDALEPDNIDGYANDSGFPLTYQNQLTYNIFLANQAHARGLSIGLKNDLGQVNALLPHFDWALVEECFYYQECSLVKPFLNAGKAVFETEYTDDGMTLPQFCPRANALNMNSLLKQRDLGVWRRACR